MKNYKSTFLTSKTKSEKYVLDLLEELNKKNGVVGETEKTFGEYTKDYFIWGKCPYFKRRIEYEGRNLTQRYCDECYRILDTKIRGVSWFCKKKMSEIRKIYVELCATIGYRNRESAADLSKEFVKNLGYEAISSLTREIDTATFAEYLMTAHKNGYVRAAFCI